MYVRCSVKALGGCSSVWLLSNRLLWSRVLGRLLVLIESTHIRNDIAAASVNLGPLQAFTQNR